MVYGVDFFVGVNYIVVALPISLVAGRASYAFACEFLGWFCIGGLFGGWFTGHGLVGSSSSFRL